MCEIEKKLVNIFKVLKKDIAQHLAAYDSTRFCECVEQGTKAWTRCI